MTGKNPKVDAWLAKAKTWQAEIKKLRAIALECGLTEELKWGKPCYSFQNGNVLILQGFKDSCALLFFKGSLLKDPKNILERPGENSHVGRRIRFTHVKDITRIESTLKAYIKEAIKNESAGLKVETKKKAEPIPEELQKKMDNDRALKDAFYALTPGRQRGYLLYFSSAKQSKTRESRIEKYRDKILDGLGIHD